MRVVCALLLALASSARGDDRPTTGLPDEPTIPPALAGDERKLAIWGLRSLLKGPGEPLVEPRGGAKRVKWEYAELSYRTAAPPPRREGVEDDNAKLPGPAVTIRWTTGAQEVLAKGWDEMAEKLLALKTDASPTVQRVRVLNEIGAAGWELVAQQASAAAPPGAASPDGPGGATGRPVTTVLLFKRQVP